jgi:hypothetical protein
MNRQMTHQVVSESRLNLLIDLGLLDPRADDEFTAFRIWGAILSDRVLFQKLSALPRDPADPAVIPAGAREKVIAEMSALEREQLGSRVFQTLGVGKA